MRLRLRSLQAQLAIRLTALILVATALGVGAIVYEGMNAADALGNEQLARRAAEIAQYVEAGSDGTLHLELPAKLDQTYRSPSRTDIYALRAGDGRLIAASEPELADVIAHSSTAGAKPHPLRLEEFGSTGQDYYGLVVSAASSHSKTAPKLTSFATMQPSGVKYASQRAMNSASASSRLQRAAPCRCTAMPVR
jgi:hypothetical protein